MPKSTNEPVSASSSLIHKEHVQKSHPAYFLWLLVLIILGACGFMGYMLYTQQMALDSYRNGLTAYQDSMRQWTDQVNTLQSVVQDLRTKATQTPTAVPTVPANTASSSPNALSSVFPSSLGQLFASPIANNSSARPSSTPQGELGGEDGSDLYSPDQGDDEYANSDSLSGGRLSAEDERGMLETYLAEIKQGQHKTSQPDGLSVFKNRQVSADGQTTYDIFRSTNDEELFFIYIRKTGTATGREGWYGPFSSFPGS